MAFYIIRQVSKKLFCDNVFHLICDVPITRVKLNTLAILVL